MAKIASFRGYRYNPSVVGDLSKVVTQPYDKIDDPLREVYLTRNQYNLVRIIKGPVKPNDTVNDNQYTRAADFWKQWIEDRVFLREAGPAVYPYTQEFTIDGKTCTRKGLIALVNLEDDKSAVRAHEKTLSGPKADRLKLMRATEANDGQIFMLYDDQAQKINNLIEPELMGAQPIMQVKDDFDATHRLYRLSRPGAIADIAEAFEGMDLFIADGHHRYETAVNYLKECKARNWKPMGVETFTHRMMTMISMQDSGLTVLPTHRMIHSLPSFKPDAFINAAGANFDVASFSDRPALYAALDAAGTAGKTAFGFAAEGIAGYRSLTLKNPALMDQLVTDKHSPAWKRLDVTVLHIALMEKLMGIDAEKLAAETNVHYVRGRDEALDLVGKGSRAAFLVNPTRVDQVREVALAGERMPQKSTDFFPKLLSGMVLMKMAIDKSAGIAMWKADE